LAPLTAGDPYERTVQAYASRPDSTGVLVNWVCRDNLDYLDLSEHRFELSPP